MNPIDMKKFENIKFGVELDGEGNTLNDGQGGLLKIVNMLGIAGVLFLATVIAGIVLHSVFLNSPLLMLLGNIISLISLLAAQLGTAIWWFITGTKEPMNYIYQALPFGGVQLKTSVCLMPLTIIILVIMCRVYSKVFIKKTIALIISLGLISSIVGLSMWVDKLL